MGIIPACAGSTNHRPHLSFTQLGSSPHARGALKSDVKTKLLSKDHPRMRGEHGGVVRRERLRRGIIPACAGSTALSV